ncbi:MAG: flavin reductase family protein [Chloroflexota bacterium]|nr:flavin reductase family protein [Chloroflexota bacterium]
MDEAARKTTLRMIPYGLFVVTARSGDEIAAGTINWLTQASFQPPLVALGLKADSGTLAQVRQSGQFAVNVLGSGQKDMAFAFFKPTRAEGGRLNGYAFEDGSTGAPLLLDAPAWFECRLTDVVDRGDHHIVVGEVIEAGVRRESPPLTLAEVGVFYGG